MVGGDLKEGSKGDEASKGYPTTPTETGSAGEQQHVSTKDASST